MIDLFSYNSVLYQPYGKYVMLDLREINKLVGPIAANQLGVRTTCHPVIQPIQNRQNVCKLDAYYLLGA